MAIGKLFHIIHMTGDLPALEDWYDDVFSVRRGFLDHNYMPGEKRDASLVVLGDCVIEPLLLIVAIYVNGVLQGKIAITNTITPGVWDRTNWIGWDNWPEQAPPLLPQ